MSLKNDLHYPDQSPAGRTVIQLADLKKQIELMAGVRHRIKSGYYDQPNVLTVIANRLSQRIKE
jgi:hypothetical protein